LLTGGHSNSTSRSASPCDCLYFLLSFVLLSLSFVLLSGSFSFFFF